MLVEILECVECGRRIVRIGGKYVKMHHGCTGQVKLLAESEVSMMRSRELLRDLMERGREEKA